MRVIVLHNTNATDALLKNNQSEKNKVGLPLAKEMRNIYLEQLDKDENLGIVQVDDPLTRNARYHGIDDRLPRYRIMIPHSELDLVLREVSVNVTIIDETA